MNIEEFCEKIEYSDYSFLDSLNTIEIINFIHEIENTYREYGLTVEDIFSFVFHIAKKYGLFIEKLPSLLFKKEMVVEKYDRGEDKKFFDNALSSVGAIIDIYPHFKPLNQFYEKYGKLSDMEEERMIILMNEGDLEFESDFRDICKGRMISPEYDFSYMYYQKLEDELSQYIKEYDQYFIDGILDEGFVEDIRGLSEYISKYNPELSSILSSLTVNLTKSDLEKIYDYVNSLL